MAHESEDWVQCRERSPEGTYCVELEGHEGQHQDKWGMIWTEK